MPGSIMSRRRRRTVEDDGDDDSDDESPRSIGSKRARTAAGTEDENVFPVSYRSVPRPGRRTNGVNGANGASSANGAADPCVYQPGAIIRVKLKNFITYTAAEFHVGPNLNMVIGPNGTGKSTLVAAICLGLAFPAKVMGRAKAVGEYMRHQMNSAEIEIELQAGPNQSKNPVIRRVMKKDPTKKSSPKEGDAKTTWYINDQIVPQKDVEDLVRKKMSIQIDNLCHFLPQDRVVEFAAMDGVELLQATQRAVAPPQMQAWHDELKDLDKKRREWSSIQDSKKEQLTAWQAKQASQKGEVERIRERNGMVEQLTALEKFRPVIDYNTTLKKHNQLLADEKTAKEDLASLQRQVEPSLQAVRAKEEYNARLDRWVVQRRKAVTSHEGACGKAFKKIDLLSQSIGDANADWNAEANSKKPRAAEMKRIQGSIRNIQIEMEKVAMEEPDTRPLNARKREKEAEIDEINNKAGDIRDSMNDINRQARQIEGERQSLETALENFKSVENKKLRQLRQYSSDTARAWEWILKHRDEFTGPVYGPPLIECRVTDPRYAGAIESLMGKHDFLCFTVTNRADRDRIMDNLTARGTMGLRDVSIFNTNGLGMDRWLPPCSDEEMKSLGLQGWGIDYIDGPDAIKSVLCEQKNLHKVGITLEAHSEAQFQRLRDHARINRWVEGGYLRTVSRRAEYGPQAVSTGTRQVRAPQIWHSQEPTSNDDDRSLRMQRDEKIDQLAQLDGQRREFEAQKEKLRDRRSLLQEEVKAIDEEKSSLQKAYSLVQALPHKLKSLEDKLAVLEQAQDESQERMDAINTRLDQLTFEKAQLSVDYSNAVEPLRKAVSELHEAELWSVESKSDLEVLREKNKETEELLQTIKKHVAGLTAEKLKAKGECKTLARAVKAMMENLTEGEHLLQELMDREMSQEDLRVEIERTENRLSLLGDSDPAKIKAYEDRQLKIEQLEEQLRLAESDMESLKEQIKTLREQWEPELDSLMGKINEAFSFNFTKIGCAGQVELYKDEDDFEKWSIRIQVKFRENEPLSILNSQRQSGGERSVSTMLYLLSLHSLSRAPFRIVDEINQGMDPRNERVMHERIVDISCDEEGTASQYFLVTPKLLPGLKYHRRMRTHVIQSGDWMPKDYKELDVKRVLQIARAVKGSA